MYSLYTGAGGTPLCQLLKFLLNNLRYQIRLHLLSKAHYDFKFRQFVLENHIHRVSEKKHPLILLAIS